MEAQLSIDKQQSVLFIKKYRESESDEKINNQRKSQICHFLDNYVQQKLTQECVEESARKEITLGVIDEYTQNIVTLTKILGNNLLKYRDLIKKLNHQLLKIQQKFERIRKQCFLIKSVLRMKISQLQAIHIEYYALNPFFFSPAYSVSADSFFRVVHQNARLKEVTIKGVIISSFQQFITDLADPQSYLRFQRWINEFKPSIYCKFALNSNIFIDIRKKKTLSFIKDLKFFVGLFYELSQIIIAVQLGKWYEITERQSILWNLWEGIKRIRKIELVIRTLYLFSTVPNQTIPFLRTSLFAGLATLTEIHRLQFDPIQFSQTVQVNHMLAIEQLFHIIFENNAIKHLKFCNFCKNFPIIPQNISLQSISFSPMLFRKDIDLTRRLTKDRALFLSYIQEDLLHDAQKIEIQFLVNVNLVNISLSPSNIKCLTVQSSTISLQAIFSELFSLKCLNLTNCHLSHQVICSIPSPNLEEMSLQQNHSITNEGLKDIDSKWPNLRYLRLHKCRNITAEIWKECSFGGLTTVFTDDRILPKEIKDRQLKSKGVLVKVSIF